MICGVGVNRQRSKVCNGEIRYEYQMASHLAVCFGPVTFRAMWINRHLVWSEVLERLSSQGFPGLTGGSSHGTSQTGAITTDETLYFDYPDLMGDGDGVRGDVEFYVGQIGQQMSARLASNAYGGTPSSLPGMSGVAMLYFHDFVWGVNKEKKRPKGLSVSVQVTYAPQYLDPAASLIAKTGTVRYATDRTTGNNVENTSTIEAPTPPDANPAHVLYELLRDPDYGLGVPTSRIDTQSFLDAAAVLDTEGLGISFVWARQKKVEEVIKDIIDTIQAVMTVNPDSGKWRLRLLRSDYQSDDPNIRTITPSVADVTQYACKACAATINQVTVLWTDPATETQKSVSAQDTAAINAFGQIVADTRNYYMIRDHYTAWLLALRDLRQAGYNQRLADVKLDRSFWNLQPGDLVRFNWPEYETGNIIMRVTSVDYGAPGKMPITATLAEDIYSLAPPTAVPLPYAAWDATLTDPTPLDQQVIMTAPYALVSNEVNISPEAWLIIMARDSAPDCSGFSVAVETTDGAGNTVWTEEAALPLTDKGTLGQALTIEWETTIPVDQLISSFAGAYGPETGNMLIFGDGEDDHEIVIIKSYDSVNDEVTLLRGAFDTLPSEWPVGTSVWVWNQYIFPVDPVAHNEGASFDVKLLTRTGLGVLDASAATATTVTPSSRANAPLRPANMVLAGTAWPATASHSGSSDVTVTWANRNRVAEDGVAVAWDGATRTPESGQRTRIEVLDSGGTVLATHVAAEGDTSFDIPLADFGTAPVSRKVRLTAVRDEPGGGTSDSWKSVIQDIDIT